MGQGKKITPSLMKEIQKAKITQVEVAQLLGVTQPNVSFVENGTLKRNLDTTTLRALLLAAMDMPAVETKREPTKTMKESETEITVG